MASNHSQNISDDKGGAAGSHKEESKHEIEDDERSQERPKSDDEEFVNQGEWPHPLSHLLFVGIFLINFVLF
jgi:hypothetical protein